METMQKTLDENFIDWEADAFGFGYGSGEPHIIPAVKTFFSLCNALCNQSPNGAYDYTEIEAALTPTVAWLLINVMGHQDVIEYGTSPRYGWLTPQGQALKAFVDGKTADELLALTQHDESYIGCSRDACNCGPNGYQEGVKCNNPFWWAA